MKETCQKNEKKDRHTSHHLTLSTTSYGYLYPIREVFQILVLVINFHTFVNLKRTTLRAPCAIQ